jgi:hypothetical protein
LRTTISEGDELEGAAESQGLWGFARVSRWGGNQRNVIKAVTHGVSLLKSLWQNMDIQNHFAQREMDGH